MGRTIFESKNKLFRIKEEDDHTYQLDDLKGDCFNPRINPEIIDLKEQESLFETRVSQEGVFGYVLERWNPEPGIGYEHVDSCWGFIGMYSLKYEENKHYIVDELMSQIPTEEK